MIAFLTGRIASKEASSALLDVGGVGFSIAMTTRSLASLPAVGDEVTVWTHLSVREDGMALFGFRDEAERDAFEQLITVSGVGPRVALSTLSSLSADDLASAVATEDVALLSNVPGVGKKTAQRIILDLKDKLGVGDIVSGPKRGGAAGAAVAEANDALLSMGFSSTEAAAALKGAEGDTPEALLQFALKRLGGGR